MAHTPGPWMVKKEWSDDPIEFQQEIFTVEAKDGSLKITLDGAYVGRDEQDAQLIAASVDLLADLQVAAETFRRYEELHRAKGVEGLEKAEANAALARRFEATIAAATGAA